MRGFNGVSNPFSGVEETAGVVMVDRILFSFSSLALVPVKILFPFPRPALRCMPRCTITLSPASTVFGSAHINQLAMN